MKETEHLAIILWSFDSFVIFPNFLRSSVLSRSGTCGTKRISSHLWWKENLVKHWKVSKYYKTDCLINFLLLFMFLLTAKLPKSVILKLQAFSEYFESSRCFTKCFFHRKWNDGGLLLINMVYTSCLTS